MQASGSSCGWDKHHDQKSRYLQPPPCRHWESSTSTGNILPQAGSNLNAYSQEACQGAGMNRPIPKWLDQPSAIGPLTGRGAVFASPCGIGLLPIQWLQVGSEGTDVLLDFLFWVVDGSESPCNGEFFRAVISSLYPLARKPGNWVDSIRSLGRQRKSTQNTRATPDCQPGSWPAMLSSEILTAPSLYSFNGAVAYSLHQTSTSGYAGSSLNACGSFPVLIRKRPRATPNSRWSLPNE